MLVVLAPRSPTRSAVRSLRVALEGVVHELRDVEELLAADDDLPLGLDARRRASAAPACRGSPTRRRRTRWPTGAGPAGPASGSASSLDLLDQRAADEMRVVGQALVTDAHRLKHLPHSFALARLRRRGVTEEDSRSPAAYCSGSVRYFTSVTDPSPNSHSSTVARMIARPSSCSSSETVEPSGPPISSTRRSSPSENSHES